LGVSLCQPSLQPLAAEDQDKEILFDRLHKYLHTWQLDIPELLAEFDVCFCGDMPCSPVGNETLLVYGAKVAPGGHIFIVQVEPNAQ